MDSNFNNVPPFPSDVPTIDLRCLSYTKLLEKDVSESEQLFKSCTENGFFLLNLQGSTEGNQMLELAQFAFELSEDWSTKSDKEELEKYAWKPPGSIFGYKGLGKTKTEDGKPDNAEFYSMAQDDMIGTVAPSAHPPIVEQARPKIKDYCIHAHSILIHLMSHLDKHLGLEDGTLASLNPIDQPSGTALRMLHAPPLPAGSAPCGSVFGHTDFGSMTLLFNIVGGLQVLVPPDAENIDANYRYVKPQPGCAIINLGDAMIPWSGGLLKSNMHRVVVPPGEQKSIDRYSLAYPMRPAANASMRRLARVGASEGAEMEENGGRDICAKDWEKLRVARIVEGNLKRVAVTEVREITA